MVYNNVITDPREGVSAMFMRTITIDGKGGETAVVVYTPTLLGMIYGAMRNDATAIIDGGDGTALVIPPGDIQRVTVNL